MKDDYTQAEVTITDDTAWTAGPVSYDIKAVFASSDSNEYGGAVEAQAQFVLTVVDACYYNVLTCEPLDDIVFTINADSTSPGEATQSTVSCAWSAIDNAGAALSDTECPVT